MMWSDDDDDEEDEQWRRRRRAAIVVGGAVAEVALSCAKSCVEDEEDTAAPVLLHLQGLASAVAAVMARRQRRRSVSEKEWWIRPRSMSTTWMEMDAMDNDTFHRIFNMTPTAFDWLTAHISPLVLKSDTNFRSSIPPRKRVAMGIYRLASGASYLDVSRMFAVGEATVLTCSRELAGALSTAFGHVLGFPRGPTALGRIRAGFGLSKCSGALGVSRFRIKRPANGGGDEYLDQDSKNYTIAVQFVVDTEMRILNMAAGFPGGMPPAQMLKLCSLFENAGDLLGGGYLMASSGADYPPLPWILQTDEPLSSVHRVLAELGKWKVLEKTCNVDVQTAVELLVSCAILHNILLIPPSPN